MGRRARRGLRIAALDETGQGKQGTAKCGVNRQYMGCAGRLANGINTVHVAHVRERVGHALIGARQWIPAEHLTDPDAQAVVLLAKDKRRWQIRSAGAGPKGQRWYAWAWIATVSPRHYLCAIAATEPEHAGTTSAPDSTESIPWPTSTWRLPY